MLRLVVVEAVETRLTVMFVRLGIQGFPSSLQVDPCHGSSTAPAGRIILGANTLHMHAFGGKSCNAVDLPGPRQPPHPTAKKVSESCATCNVKFADGTTC